ncbi:MAG TPA: hypothetical protein VEB68_01200 [Croceibacterium sp.]|nr:hypothetical protein [Croceibacterium sp.]
MTARARLLALALAASLAGCTTPAYVSPVEVTRFVGEQPAVLGSGPIAVQAAPGVATDSWEYAAFENAVAQELTELGYTVTGDMAQQVAEIGVHRVIAQSGGGRSPVNVGVGGSTGSYGSGVGMGIGINLGGNRPAERIDTELRVVIKPSGGVNALWEGRARFSATANSDFADQRAAAGKLADALFDGFPGRSGETIEVR